MPTATENPTTQIAVPQPVQRALVTIEGSAVMASAELVYQRGDLAEYQRIDPRRDELVTALIAAGLAGDTRAVRYLAPQVIAADRECDSPILRADTRRENAHGYTRRIASQIELTLTVRSILGVI